LVKQLVNIFRLKPRTNQPILEILYVKGSSNEADALSRRLELHHKLAAAEELLLDKDLENMHDFLSSMTHLQLDANLPHKIRIGYALDPTYCKKPSNGAHFDPTGNLHWMTD
jgi:hypothetical protein